MSSLKNLLLAAGVASAATIRIDVGESGLKFSPNETTAAVGDMVEFHFYARNHSVAQGDFANACSPVSTGGFFSGYVPTSSGENANVFMIMINNTNPLAFYCTQSNNRHCQSGMVGVINPSGSQSFASYVAAAQSAKSLSEPASVFGGMLGPSMANGTATTTSSGSPSSTGTSSGSGTSSTSSPSTTTKPNEAGSLGASFAGLVVACAAVVGTMMMV